MIKNIVFDMGNVLLTFDGLKFTKNIIDDDTLVDIFADAVFKSHTWIELDKGIISDDDAIKKMEESLPDTLKPKVREAMYHWYDTLYPVKGMVQLVKELKDKGYTLSILSNAGKTFHNYIRKVPGTEYMDFIFCSADYKMLKPELEIYNKFFEVTNSKPEECLFVDDLKANIEGSIKAGMDGIIFTGAENLRHELINRGLL